MYYYRDTPVYIGTTGIFARSASINASASIDQSSMAGLGLSSNYKNGPLTASLSLEYSPLINHDPILKDVLAFKNHAGTGFFPETPVPVVIKVGNISGSFFLNSFSFNLSENSLFSASASFDSFHPISGNGEMPASVNLINNRSKFGNSASVTLQDPYGAENTGNIYSFSYNFQKTNNPNYFLNNTFSVDCFNANESSEITFSDFVQIFPTGRLVNEYLNGFYIIDISPYIPEIDHNGSGISGITIKLNLDKQIVTSQEITNSVGEIQRFKITAERTF